MEIYIFQQRWYGCSPMLQFSWNHAFRLRFSSLSTKHKPNPFYETIQLKTWMLYFWLFEYLNLSLFFSTFSRSYVMKPNCKAFSDERLSFTRKKVGQIMINRYVLLHRLLTHHCNFRFKDPGSSKFGKMVYEGWNRSYAPLL